jgi:hypothetical protein
VHRGWLVSNKRPGIGLHVRITDHFPGEGPRQPYDVVYDGIVAREHVQPKNPQMVALKPVDADGPLVTVNFDRPPGTDRVESRTLEIIGWPVGMIALWSAYMPDYLRDAYLNVPMRWDGELWFALPGKDFCQDAIPHNGQPYGPPGERVCPAMVATVWDGVVPS